MPALTQDPVLRERLQRPKAFKYPGDKSWLVESHLWEIWKLHAWRRFNAPFCGSAADAFLLQPEQAQLTDYNRWLCFALLWLQAGAPKRVEYRHSAADYYRLRDYFNARREFGEMLELGHCAWILANTSYRGLWRMSRKTGFNVPFGDRSGLPDLDVDFYSEIMSKWRISPMSFPVSLRLHLQDDDFLFLDPPYLGGFTGYLPDGFSESDLRWMLELSANHPGPTVACNSWSPVTEAMHEEYGFTCLKVPSRQKMQKGRGSQPQNVVHELLGVRNV